MVHIWPGSDTDSICVWRYDKVFPIFVDFGYVEFVGYSLARILAAVGYANHFDPINRLEAWDMQACCITTSSYNSYSYSFVFNNDALLLQMIETNMT